jgi:phosphatidylethanolamine/phosphatidyl-N-methylethanolamine N-methyltransferase
MDDLMSASSGSFLLNFIRNPRATGAVAPATRTLARSVAAAAHHAYARHRGAGAHASLRVLELGAGTGALTRAISGLGPTLVEQDAGWAALLRDRYPALEVREACATEVLAELREPAGIVSSIPLLNNPRSSELKRLLAQRYAEGLLRFCVLYTYGWRDPLAGSGFREVRRASFVPRSLPPAHVWVYQ